jgi:hypothetical protein
LEGVLSLLDGNLSLLDARLSLLDASLSLLGGNLSLQDDDLTLWIWCANDVVKKGSPQTHYFSRLAIGWMGAV